MTNACPDQLWSILLQIIKTIIAAQQLPLMQATTRNVGLCMYVCCSSEQGLYTVMTLLHIAANRMWAQSYKGIMLQLNRSHSHSPIMSANFSAHYNFVGTLSATRTQPQTWTAQTIPMFQTKYNFLNNYNWSKYQL